MRVSNSRFDGAQINLTFRYEPESVHIEAMALLLVDQTETSASGRILAVGPGPARRHFLVDEGHAYFAGQTVVAVSGGVEIRGFRFRFRQRAAVLRK